MMIKLFVSVLVLVVCVSAASIFEETKLGSDAEWHAFKAKHGKTYHLLGEEAARRRTWSKNSQYVAQHNEEAAKGVHTFTLEMNKYADMSTKEFTNMMNGYRGKVVSEPRRIFKKPSNVQIPDAVDWRDKGFVTPVKNQEQCGSCWAFSAVASLEGQHFNKTGKLVSLSEQNLVDCSQPQGNQGCNGGLMDQAFKYIIDNKGIDTEDSYPYKAVDGKCSFNAATVGATVTGYTDVPTGNEAALTDAIATVGPIAVAIDASHITFQLYKEGVYYAPLCSSTKLDHGVTAVGYGTENGKDFYWVKNSWAEVWGIKGYIKMSRNRNNNCGIATSASFPLV